MKLTYSPKLREALDELRPAFREMGQGFEQLTRKRAEVAPMFTRAYRLWQRETKKPFIAFVHELDSSMPVGDRSAYRHHRSYRAAQYLLQLAEQPEKTASRGRSPLAVLAQTIKTLLPLAHPHQKETLAILLRATGWRERDQTKLIARIRKARQLALPQFPRIIKSAEASKAAVIAFEREHVA